MKNFKTKSILVLILSFLCAALLCCSISFMSGKKVSAQTSAVATTQIICNGEDIFNDDNGSFDSTHLDELAAAILGTGNKFKDLLDYSGVKDSTEIYSVNNKDIVVKFGGFTWTPVYLSDSINGDKVLTLWLTDSAQLQNKTSPFAVNASGAGWYGTGAYPSAMYGRSYVRINMLNAGGQWATSASTLSAEYAQSASNEWARFTMEQEALGGSEKSFVQFLATPAEMEWQALENAATPGYTGFDNTHLTMSNESYLKSGEKSYSGTTFTGTYRSASANAESCSGYSDWQDDYVWLPSMVEIGQTAANNPTASVWKCTATQRASSADNFVRSMTYDMPTRSFLVQAGGGIWYPSTTTTAEAIRPCIHLNLSSIGLASQGDTKIESIYNGNVKSFTDFSPLPGWASLIEGTDYVVTPKFSGEMKNVGEYTYTVELKNTTDYWWLDTTDPLTDTKRDFIFTIKRKGVAVPTINDSEQTYKGAAYEFYLNSAYNANLMDMTYPDSVDYNSDDKAFSATNAGTYKINFTLKDTANYGWGADGSTDISQKSVPLTINKKDISNSIRVDASDDGLQWKKKDEGTITLTALTYNSEEVSLYVYYVLRIDDDEYQYHSPAVTGHVLNISKITRTGTFTLCAKLIEEGEDGYVAGNANYVISTDDGVWVMPSTFEITAGGIGADDLTWQYKMTGQALPCDLIDGDGLQVKLQYGVDINYTISALGNSDMEVYTGYSGDGYVDGYKTVDSNGNVVNGGGCGAVGTYTTYVAIKITNTTEYAFDSDHILDGNSKYGWLSFEWTISPRELDFADAEWEYSTDGGDNWVPFKQADGTLSDPEYTGLPISIRISPDYIASLGLDPDTDISISYGGTTAKKDKGSYTASAELVITNSSYCTPETADGSDYSISFHWSITNKKIQIKNWNGSHTIVLDDGRAFSVPTVQTSDGLDYSGYLVYTYECVIGGVTQKATDFDGLKALLEQAGVSDSNSLTITATVAVKATQQDSFTLAGTATKEFELGDSKDVISVWLDNETSQYGDVKFGLHAENDGVDYLQYIQVTLSSVLLSEPVTVAGSNVSALMEYLVKTGTYSIALELDARYATGYLLNPTTLSFEITPKEVYVPTVSREIVFTGSNIDLSRYLDGFDPAIMTLDALPKRDAGTVYTAIITLIDQFNYVFVMKPEPDADATKSTVKLVLTGYENSINFANDEHTSVDLKWQINPFVLDSSYLNTSGKEGVQFIMPTGFGEIDLEAGYRYFDDAASTTPMDPVFKGGNSFYADVFLTGEDAKNFVFENGTTVSDKVVYTVPQSGAAAFFGSALSFVKSNWLWFVIGAAVLLFLILLIIIIAVAKKKKKKKEEEKGKSTNAAAGAMPMAAMAGLAMADDGRAARAEAEAAKAKAQIEIERAKMEAEMAKMRAQMEARQQQIESQQMPQPVQQPAQQIQQIQPYPQQMPMMQQFPQQMPAQSADGGMMMAMMQAQLAEMRAQQNAALKTELEIVKAKLDSRHENYSNDKPSVSAELLGNAIISAISKFVAAKSSQSGWDQQVIKSDPPMALNAPTVYPPDAVITTTTTTVDTTNRQNEVKPDDYESNNRSRDLPFDIDGFYDAIDEKFKK